MLTAICPHKAILLPQCVRIKAGLMATNESFLEPDERLPNICFVKVITIALIQAAHP